MRRLRTRNRTIAAVPMPMESSSHGQMLFTTGGTTRVGNRKLMVGVASLGIETLVVVRAAVAIGVAVKEAALVDGSAVSGALAGGTAVLVTKGCGVTWTYVVGEAGCSSATATTIVPAKSTTSPTSSTSIRWSVAPISPVPFYHIQQPCLPAALEQQLVALPHARQIGAGRHARHGRFADEDVPLVAANHHRRVLDGDHAQRSIGKPRRCAGVHCTFALGDERGKRRAPQGRAAVLIGRNPQQARGIPSKRHKCPGVVGGWQIRDDGGENRGPKADQGQG